ncbi:acyl-CoA thioesterase [Nitratireductor sp. CAU 1489]|uniref:Acyl-CoA thioesterase n=1 Tax=Nitratireductor arenosus TaxID=2682096 RepID=A0A844QMT5_9HYPH|nr:acyl-CoA thioesterase [Nitratireductor arenosus]MVA99260.1 acyl-CoA thioesterase [Nitratireductor arenosus]
MPDPAFTARFQISFGDCDPAGIVFYPNFYRWFDATCHAWFRAAAGSHARLCERLGTVGVGLVDSGASFRSPATEGDVLDMALHIEAWNRKTLRLGYRGTVGGRLVVEGFEVRAVFVHADGRMRAGETAPLRALLEGTGDNG